MLQHGFSFQLNSISIDNFFLSSNKKFLACGANTDSNIIQREDVENDHNSSLSLRPTSNLELLVNQFNNATPQNGNDPEKIASPKYTVSES